jgi:RHS repeat-associated protein
VYLGGLWEEDVVGGVSQATRSLYSFNGTVVAQRDANGVVYLHGDHLGSISVATNASGAKLSSQEYDPWGKVRAGSSIGQTALNYTGQRLDTTGLLYYHARYYDPNLGRFVSADTLVPGAASGKGGAAATLGYDSWVELRPLTVDFHESDVLSTLNGENAFTMGKGFWFQLSNEEKAKSPWGPLNPQALNRYSYVLNNPLRYTDPTGHSIYLTKPEALAYVDKLKQAAAELRQLAKIVGYASAVTYGVRHAISLPELAKAFPALARLAPYLLVAAAAGALLALDLNLSAEQVEEFAAEVSKVVNNSGSGVILSYPVVYSFVIKLLLTETQGTGLNTQHLAL